MLPYVDILKFVIGEFGTYQKCCFFLLCISAIPIGMWTVSPVFLHADTDHWCKVPESNVITSTCIAYNVSDDCPRFTKDLTIPKEKYQNGCTSEWKYSNCYAYDRNVTMENLLLGDFGFLNTSDVVECQHGWEYDATRTTVNQEVWDLFGRMTSLIIAVSTLVVFSLLEALAPSFALFAIGRVTAGTSRYGIYSQVFVLMVELVGPSKRGMVIMVYYICYCFGYAGLAPLAYLIRNWRVLLLTATSPALIVFIYWWLVPESPRWLIAVGKMDEAEKVIRKIGRGNKVLVPDEIFKARHTEIRRYTTIDKALSKKEPVARLIAKIFLFPNMRKKSLISCFSATAVCITYYGFLLNTNVGGSNYLNVALSGLMEIPAYLATAVLIETRFGRRFTIFGASLLCSSSAIATTFSPKCGSLLWFRIVFFMIGKFGVAVTYAIVGIYTAELYPTTVRSIGVSITCISGMLGATFAPQVLLLSNLWEPLPMTAIAVLQLIAGILALVLPETRGKKLPETIEEGETFGRKKPTKEKDCKRSNAVKPGQIIKISSMHMSKTKEDFI
ncbi:organic cation transporter protein-like [Glandiceps talaboti]